MPTGVETQHVATEKNHSIHAENDFSTFCQIQLYKMCPLKPYSLLYLQVGSQGISNIANYILFNWEDSRIVEVSHIKVSQK